MVVVQLMVRAVGRCCWSDIIAGFLKISIMAVLLAVNPDGLVKSPIYVVVDLKRRFAVPYVLSNRRLRYYA
jgi:hypothetical protein